MIPTGTIVTSMPGSEVYLPGGGWRGYEPTHDLAVADHHVALVAAPNFTSHGTAFAAAIRPRLKLVRQRSMTSS